MEENQSVYERICRTRRNGRATSMDYITSPSLFTDFCELHGDRAFADDHAIVGGIAKLRGMPVTVIGIGYRKALRLIREAEKFHRPVICFVDTQGANCGKGAEERGAGEAIAQNLYELSTVKTPVISLMIGEGGSGGALALAVADRVWMLENAYYSVISPESCASILFKDPARAPEAAEHLRLTADDLLSMGIIERKVAEPADFTDEAEREAFMSALGDSLAEEFRALSRLSDEKLVAERIEKYRKIGRYDAYSTKNSFLRKWHFFSL